MATSPDGVLTANFDPVRNLVSLLVAGQAWPAPGVLRTNLADPPKPVNASPDINPYQHVPAATGTDGVVTTEVASSPSTPGRDVFRVRWTTAPSAIGTTDLARRPSLVPVTPGKWYGVLVSVTLGGGITQNLAAGLQWLDAGGGGIPQTHGPTQNVGGSEVWLQAVGQAPANAANVRVDVLDVIPPTTLWTVGSGYDLRETLILEADTQAAAQAAVDAGYFDGDTADADGREYRWLSTPNASPSVEEWIYDVPDQVTITRSVDGASPIPVRGAEMSTAPGGTFVWSDNEAPLDASVVYTVQGYAGGSLVGTSTVTVETTGAAWGVWVKVPGRPELTVRAPLVALDDETRETLGGSWQIPGGPRISQSGSGALAQSAGMGALVTAVTLQAVDRTARAALDRAVRQAPGQVLLIQTGQPEELASGYYQAGQSTWSNPAQVRSDQYAKRYLTLPITEAVMPAGPASGWTGVTYTDVTNAFDTYQAIDDAGLSYMDVATGEGWG